jgi:hypothetical protein
LSLFEGLFIEVSGIFFMTAFIKLFGAQKTIFFRMLMAVIVLSGMVVTARQFPVLAASLQYADSHPLSAADRVIAASDPFAAGVSTIVDLAPLTLNNSTSSIGFTTTNNTAFHLARREAGVNAPQLVIETAP